MIWNLPAFADMYGMVACGCMRLHAVASGCTSVSSIRKRSKPDRPCIKS